jgi:cell division protein FtsB
MEWLVALIAKFWYLVALPLVGWVWSVERRIVRLTEENRQSSMDRQEIKEAIKDLRKEIREDIHSATTQAENHAKETRDGLIKIMTILSTNKGE